MSSSGECELDSESTPVVAITSVAVKMGESSGGGKKTIYTRKKSTSAMQRKISAELGNKNNIMGPATATAEDGNAKGTETGDDSDSGLPSTTSNKGSSSEKYLSPRVAHPKHRHHHNSSSLRKHVLVRRSPSPSATMSPGYEQYQMALLEVPLPRDYGEASSDDLSSEWDSDAPDSRSRFLGFKV